MAAAAATRQQPPADEAEGRPGTGRAHGRAARWVRSLAWPGRLALGAGAAAAAVVLAAAVVFGVSNGSMRQQLGQAQASSQQIAVVLTAQDAVMMSGQVTGGGTAAIVMSHSRDALVFTARGLPALPGSRGYELWLIGPAGARPVAMLPAARPRHDRPGRRLRPAPGRSSRPHRRTRRRHHAPHRPDDARRHALATGGRRCPPCSASTWAPARSRRCCAPPTAPFSAGAAPATRSACPGPAGPRPTRSTGGRPPAPRSGRRQVPRRLRSRAWRSPVRCTASFFAPNGLWLCAPPLPGSTAGPKPKRRITSGWARTCAPGWATPRRPAWPARSWPGCPGTSPIRTGRPAGRFSPRTGCGTA